MPPAAVIVRILALAAIVSIAVGAYTYSNQECTVGVSGAVATITVHGPTATSICGQVYFDDGTPTYRRTSPSTISVVCEYDRRGHHFTVRDQGALLLYGSTLCEWVRNLR